MSNPKTKTARRKRPTKTKEPQKSSAVNKEDGNNLRLQTGERHTGNDDRFEEVHPTKRQRLKWKPVRKTSIEFVDGIFDQTITKLLANATPSSYNAIQDNLNALRSRCVRKLRGQHAPTGFMQVNYKTLRNTMAQVEKQLTQTSAQLEKLEQELELAQRVNNQQKDELDKFAEFVDPSDLQQTTHPLLTDHSDSLLGLPDLPKSSQTEAAMHEMQFAKSLKFTTGFHVQELVTATAALVGTLPETSD